MSETAQLIIVAVIVGAAGVLLIRALRRSDEDCPSCPLNDSCRRKSRKSRLFRRRRERGC